MPVNSENPDEIKKKFIFFKEMSNNYFKEPLSDISEKYREFKNTQIRKLTHEEIEKYMAEKQTISKIGG